MKYVVAQCRSVMSPECAVTSAMGNAGVPSEELKVKSNPLIENTDNVRDFIRKEYQNTAFHFNFTIFGGTEFCLWKG